MWFITVISVRAALQTGGGFSLHFASHATHKAKMVILLWVLYYFPFCDAQMPSGRADSTGIRHSLLSCQQFHPCLDWQGCTGTLPAEHPLPNPNSPDIFSLRGNIRVAKGFKVKMCTENLCLAHWLNCKWKSPALLSSDQALSKAAWGQCRGTENCCNK